MKTITKINNQAILLPIGTLNIVTMCKDRHYSHQPPIPHPNGMAVSIMSHIMYVWYQNIPEPNPGLYFMTYHNDFGNYMIPILIDNTTNIHSFTMNIINDKSLIYLVYLDENNFKRKKWVYIDFYARIMHKSNWGNDNNNLHTGCFVNDYTFILYESENFYKYEIYNNHYIMTSASYESLDIQLCEYDSNGVGNLIYKKNSTWYSSVLDMDGNFVKPISSLVLADIYKINRGTTANNIIYGINYMKGKIYVYNDHKNLSIMYNFSYNFSFGSSDISVHLESTERLSILEIFNDYTIETILLFNKTIVTQRNINHIGSTLTWAILHSTNCGFLHVIPNLIANWTNILRCK